MRKFKGDIEDDLEEFEKKMMMEISEEGLTEDDFEDCIAELRREYDENPKKISKEVMRLLKRMKHEKIGDEILFGDVSKSMFLTCIIAILIGLTFAFHLLNPFTATSGENVGLYLFGTVFFFAGIFIGLYVPYFGLVFLFSHGISGLVMMESTFLGNIINSPQMSDNPIVMQALLGLNILILVVATVLVIIQNLSFSLKENKMFKLLPLSIYFVGIVMSGLIYTFADYIFALKF